MHPQRWVYHETATPITAAFLPNKCRRALPRSGLVQHEICATMKNVLQKRLRCPRTIDQAIEDRINGLAEWLTEYAPECREQAHLDGGSPERAYWHLGYLTALRDLQKLRDGQLGRLN
jgi:hypothetical protein